MSGMPLSSDMEREVRESLLEQILATMPYKANKKQFAGWTTHALREDLLRIEEMAKNPPAKVSTPDFSKGRDPAKALKFKTKQADLIIKEKSKGKNHRTAQGIHSADLRKLRRI